jgi:hypothetical protein
MTRAEEYRRRAEETERQAEQSRDPEVKTTFRALAQKWRDLADQLDRSGLS